MWDNSYVRWERGDRTSQKDQWRSEVQKARGNETVIKKKTWVRSRVWVTNRDPYSRWKENWEPLETNLWELEVSQSVVTFSVMLTNRKKELRFRYSGGVRFPSRDSFLIPFGSQSPELSVRWEGLRKNGVGVVPLLILPVKQEPQPTP